MASKKLVQILLLYFVVGITSSAKILGVFPFPSKSHCILGNSLLRGLAKRGHQVTMLTSHAIEDSSDNYKELVMNVNLTSKAYSDTITDSYWYTPIILATYRAFATISEAIFQDPVTQQLLNSTDEYDVIIYSHVTQVSLLGLSHKFNASSVLFSVLGTNHMMAHTMGLPHPPAYVPNLYCPYGEIMTFLERAHNLFVNAIGSLHLRFVNEAVEQKLLKQHFPDAPTLDEMIANVQLVFLNSHISLEPIRPIFQNMISIGGYYMDDRKPLSEDVAEFLNASEQGVVYFSFGSNVKYHHLSKDTIQKFLSAFEKLPFNILWKLDAHPPQLPSNVKIVNWLSQLSVLAHPNVKMFITHGGKGGMNEAIYYGKPLLYFPFYADQKMNAKDAYAAGIGLELNINDFTEDDLFRSIKELVTNPFYKRNIMQRSYLLRHQGMHPMDLAEYWVDYVSKNPNAKFLKSHATKMQWYEVMLLDIFTLLFILMMIICIALYAAIGRFVTILRRGIKIKSE